MFVRQAASDVLHFNAGFGDFGIANVGSGAIQVIEMISTGDLQVFIKKVRNMRKTEIHTYRYANKIHISDIDNALIANWCEVTVCDGGRNTPYKNVFITDHEITAGNVTSIVRSGRDRWKIEHENNNTLKTKGYDP